MHKLKKISTKWKKINTLFVSITISLFFSSCAAVGVPYTSSPDKMLYYSAQLLNENREYRAKEMLDSAFKKYTEEGNAAGLCDTYLFYSNYYRREIYTPAGPSLLNLSPEQQRKDRELHPENYIKSTHTDYDKAIESLKKAVEVCIESNRLSSVFMANLAIGETILFQKKGFPYEACKYFQESKKYYLRAERESQNVRNYEGEDFGPKVDSYIEKFCE